jgi:outer membrane protein assembly factor BamB
MKGLAGFALFIFFSVSFGQTKPEKAFTIPVKDFIPEGIAYDLLTRTFYIGSINQRKIIAIKEGHLNDLITTGQDGIGQVLGLKADNGNLWACNGDGGNTAGSIQAVHQYNLKNGRLIEKYVIPQDGNKHLLNDLVVTKGGIVFVTDSDGDCLFRIDPIAKEIEKFIESDQLRYANGITLSSDGEKLIISTGRGLLQVDVRTKEMNSLSFQSYLVIGIDGLYQYKNSLIGIQNVTFPVSINRYHLATDSKTIEQADIILVNDPLFDIPTTGVIVEDWFYFIANSQLDHWNEAERKIGEPEKLKEIVIARIKLK